MHLLSAAVVRPQRKRDLMKPSGILRSAAIVVALLAASGCANTIRGVGADAANAVEATQDAGNNVARAAQ